MAFSWDIDWTDRDTWGAGAALVAGGLLSPFTAGASLIVGGTVAAGIVANDNRNERVQEAEREAREAEEAANRAREAQWQLDMEQARRKAEQMQAQIEEMGRQSEFQYTQSYKNLEQAFGVDHENNTFGTAWNQFSQMMVQGRQAESRFEAAAGASGLKRSGTVEAMGSIQAEDIERAEDQTARMLSGQMEGGIAQTQETYRQQQNAISQAQSELDQYRADWANFNWDEFSRNTSSIRLGDLFAGNPLENLRNRDSGGSHLQKLYRAQTKAQSEAYDLKELDFKWKLEDTNPWSLSNLTSSLFQGFENAFYIGSKGKSLFGMV